MTFLEAIFARLEKDAGVPVIQEVRDGRIVSATGAELLSLFAQARAFLASRNLQKGDRCVLLAPNSIRWIAMDLALMAERLIGVPLDMRQTPAELAAMMKDCSPAHLLAASPELRDSISLAWPAAPLASTFDEIFSPAPAPAANGSGTMITARHVHLNTAWKTPQFWLIWGVLCVNVTAGIAVIAMASPMLQEVFGAGLLGLDPNATLNTAQKAAIVAAAAGLVGLISLFNSLGRIFWASLSDYLGRKNTYFVFFVLGIVLYGLLPIFENALTGLTTLPPDVMEAARGVGMTGTQQLLKVELPLALPVILAGIRFAVVVSVATATIGSTVAAHTLGEVIIAGLTTDNTAWVLQGGLIVAVMAILIYDGISALERQLMARTGRRTSA